MVFHTFPKCISPKENVWAQLEFELADTNVALQYVSQYVLGHLY